jgi:hypothetical protein
MMQCLAEEAVDKQYRCPKGIVVNLVGIQDFCLLEINGFDRWTEKGEK